MTDTQNRPLTGHTALITGSEGGLGLVLAESLAAAGANVALKLLRETGVCTISGDTFGDAGRNALRISYSTSLDQIEEAFKRIIPWMEKQNFS